MAMTKEWLDQPEQNVQDNPQQDWLITEPLEIPPMEEFL